MPRNEVQNKHGRVIGRVYKEDMYWGYLHYMSDRGAIGCETKQEAIESLEQEEQEFIECELENGLVVCVNGCFTYYSDAEEALNIKDATYFKLEEL